MHRVSLCLVTLFVCAACTTEPETTIQVRGTVTAADDGSPIAGATVTVSESGLTSLSSRARVQTNNQVDYSLSFFIETGVCPESVLNIVAEAQGFQLQAFFGFSDAPDEPRVRCTDEPQTIDFQLRDEIVLPAIKAPSVPAAFGALAI